MSNVIRHPFHLVDESPWPLLSASGVLILTSGLVKWFHHRRGSLFVVGVLILGLVGLQWWSDISKEGALQGLHSRIVELGLRYGMLLFITSEVFFFVSFFWAFFHSRLAPAVELGSTWPPVGVIRFDPFGVPLLNTLILLASGVRVTWAHHAFMSGQHGQLTQGLIITVCLGAYFSALQAMEYHEASFAIRDSVYGSTFYIATGFHGVHVLVGTMFLVVCLARAYRGQFSVQHHFGFEAAAWYWHFVDVVWLFLFVTIYWWGGLSLFSIIITFPLHWKDEKLV